MLNHSSKNTRTSRKLPSTQEIGIYVLEKILLSPYQICPIVLEEKVENAGNYNSGCCEDVVLRWRASGGKIADRIHPTSPKASSSSHPHHHSTYNPSYHIPLARHVLLLCAASSPNGSNTTYRQLSLSHRCNHASILLPNPPETILILETFQPTCRRRSRCCCPCARTSKTRGREEG